MSLVALPSSVMSPRGQNPAICTREKLKYNRLLTVFLNYHTIFMKIFAKT